MKRKTNASGFSLIEMMITLIIMAMLGLMGWRGLDGLIRGKERVEGYNNEQRDLNYALTVLNRDCNALVSADILNASPVAIGKQSVWWVRDTGIHNLPGWQIVGYNVNDEGLERLATPTYANRNAALSAWQDLLKMPDKNIPKVDSQLLNSAIIAQEVSTLSGVPGAATPVRAIQFIWHLASNDPANTRPLIRVCLAGGV